MKQWKLTRRSRTTPRRRCSATEERTPPVRDMLLARLLRALRSNPHGIGGPLVIRFLATAFAKKERGWHPDGLEAVPHDELVEWTRTIYIFLMSMSIDLRQREPDVSADATWALMQAGLTAEQLRAAQTSELERLARLAWDDDRSPPSSSTTAREGAGGR